MKKILIIFFVLFIFIFEFIALDFSADIITKSGGTSAKSKIYVSGNKSRMEMTDQKSNEKTVLITRPDKKVIWILMPGNIYMEQAFNPENIIASKDKIDGEVERKFLGKEKVNGIDTDKYKITVMTQGQKSVILAWLDKDGFPVKTSDENGKYITEYLNIKKEKQQSSLFEIPAEYQKFSM